MGRVPPSIPSPKSLSSSYKSSVLAPIHSTLILKTLVYKNQYIFVANGRLGFDVIGVDFVDFPIPNAIKLSVKARESKQTDQIAVDDNNYIYTASGRNLIIYKLLKVHNRESINIYRNLDIRSEINTFHNDENDDYLYIGSNREIKVYSKSQKKIVYEYHDIDGNITDITAKDNRVYVAVNKTKVEVLAKNRINRRFALTKVKHDGYAVKKPLASLDINNGSNQLGFTTTDGLQFGIIDMASMKTVLENNSTDANASKNKGIVNKFVKLSHQEVLSSNQGLYVINTKLNNSQSIKPYRTYRDSFNSGGFVIFDEFIVALDKSTNGTRQELKLRAYKFNTVRSSVVFGYAPLSVNFYADTINLKSIEWDFGEGGDKSVSLFTSHIYTQPGSYQVNARATYKSGRSFQNTINILVEKRETFDFIISSDDYIGAPPFEVKFYLKMNNNVDTRFIEWDFKDGTKSFEVNPRHIFKKSGTYDVTATVESIRGVRVTKTIRIIIKPILEGSIDASFVGTHPFAGDKISLKLKLKTPKPIIKYRWHLGALENNNVLFDKALQYTFNQSGIHHIKLIVTDNEGIDYEFKKTLEIFDYNRPSISMTKATGEAPLKVDFSIYVPPNMPYRLNHIKWTFPNKRVSYEKQESYLFKSEGTFYVYYEYYLSNGYTLKDRLKIEVSNDFKFNVSHSKAFGLAPLSVSFGYHGVADSGIKMYKINFGDGSKTIQTNKLSIDHTFLQPKDYVVQITAVSNGGNEVIKRVNISAMDADISYATDGIDFDQFYQDNRWKAAFNVALTNPKYLVKYMLDFGDNQQSDANVSTMSHTFTENKTYLIKFKMFLKEDLLEEKIVFVSPPTPPGNLQVYKGWNLIGNLSKTPIKSVDSGELIANEPFLDMDLFDKVKVMWIRKNGVWVKNPSFISPEYGIWLNAVEDTKLPFYGQKNDPFLDNLVRGWHLLGTGIDKNIEKYNFKYIYKYDNVSKSWIKNSIKDIKAGEGFYIFVE